MSYSVLYIEDNPLNVRLVQRFLRDLPINLYVAQDGYKGLEIVKQTSLDLILLDFNLPTISGIDVLVALKVNHSTRNIPVVTVTADDSKITRKLCKMYGVGNHLMKPISRQELINTIEIFLPNIMVTVAS